MKKVEAVGICWESTTAIDAGSCTRLVTAARRPEVRVMTKKVCCAWRELADPSGGVFQLTTTRKTKYRVIKSSSTAVWLGIP